MMEPPVLDTADPAGKIIIPLLPDYESPFPIVTLPLTPLVPALNVFNISAPEIDMPPTNPIVPVTPLTDTAPPVVVPDPDTKDRSTLIPPDDDPSIKEAPPTYLGEKLRPNLPSQGKTTSPHYYPRDSG